MDRTGGGAVLPPVGKGKIMKFDITFERVVVQTDRFTRTIEAASIEEAQEIADRATSAFDSECPDDAAPFGGDDCQSWEVHDIEAAADDAEVDELPDGDVD